MAEQWRSWEVHSATRNYIFKCLVSNREKFCLPKRTENVLSLKCCLRSQIPLNIFQYFLQWSSVPTICIHSGIQKRTRCLYMVWEHSSLESHMAWLSKGSYKHVQELLQLHWNLSEPLGFKPNKKSANSRKLKSQLSTTLQNELSRGVSPRSFKGLRIAHSYVSSIATMPWTLHKKPWILLCLVLKNLTGRYSSYTVLFCLSSL